MSLLSPQRPSSTDQVLQVGDSVFNSLTVVGDEPARYCEFGALSCRPTGMIDGNGPRSLDGIQALARLCCGNARYPLREASVSVRETLVPPAIWGG
jgi:hypothetical protein